MACNVQIGSVFGVQPASGGDPEQIIIYGKASDCPLVSVQIAVSGSPGVSTPPRQVLISPEGRWSAAFSAADGDFPPDTFRCGATPRFTVEASCMGNASCAGTYTANELSCCSIVIESIRGLVSDLEPDPVALEVSGTALGCPQVCVQVTQEEGSITDQTVELQAQVGSDNHWSVVFTAADGHFKAGLFKCGDKNKYIATARCCQDDSCRADIEGTFIPCSDCPIVTSYANVQIADECSQDGTTAVTVSALITPGSSGPAVVQWLNDAGVGPVGEVIDAPNTLYQKTLHYLPGEHFAQLYIISPADCGIYPTPPFIIPLCPTEPPDPDPDCTSFRVTDITVSEEGCDNQQRTYLATAIFEPAEMPTAFQWEWSDGFTETTSSSQSEHTLPADQESGASVAVVAMWSNGCGDLATRPFIVETCQPPDCSDYQVNLQTAMGACENNQRQVTATAQTQWSGSQYQWQWSDDQSQTTPTGTSSRTFLAGTSGYVSVFVSWPNGCQASDLVDFEVPPCGTTRRPFPIDLCFLWFVANIVLILAAGVAILITGCLVDAAVLAAYAAVGTGGVLAAFAAALTTLDIVMIIVCVVLMVVTLVSFIAWLLICAMNRAWGIACNLLGLLIGILAVLTPLSFAVGIALAIAQMAGCALGSFIDVAWFGILLSITWWVSQAVGCTLQSSS